MQNENSQEQNKPTRISLNNPIPEDHPIFEGAKIIILSGDINLAQTFPNSCDHDWAPEGIPLDADVVLVEDIDCIPVQCEKCHVGGNMSHNSTLKDGKIV